MSSGPLDLMIGVGRRKMHFMESIGSLAYERMRTEIFDAVCDRLEHELPPILENTDEQVLLHHARALYQRGGLPLPEVVSRRDIIRRIIRASRVLLTHEFEKEPLCMGDLDEARSQLQSIVDQRYEEWIEDVRSWAE